MNQELQVDLQDVVDDLAEQLKSSIVMISVLKSSLKQYAQDLTNISSEVLDLKDHISHLEALVSGLAVDTGPDTEN
jgi:septation ring formation regulator EzrA